MLFLNKLLKEIKENPKLFKNPNLNYIIGLTTSQIKELKKYAIEQNYIIQSRQEYVLTEKGKDYILDNPIKSWCCQEFPQRPELNLEYLKNEKTPAIVTRAIRKLSKHLLEGEILKRYSIEANIKEEILSEHSKFMSLQQEMENTLNNNKRHCLNDVYNKFLSYGLTKSIISILLLNILARNKKSFAIYEKYQFVLTIDTLLFDKMVLSPQNFELQRTIIEDSSLLENMSVILLPKKSNNILELTRGMVQFINSLDKYTLKTEKLSTKALKLRNTVINAKEPINLFTIDIPRIMQGKNLKDCNEGLVSEFKKAINELETATSIMIDDISKYTFQTFQVSNRETLAQRFKDVEELIASKELKIFYRNVIDIKTPQSLWIERIATYINKERVPKDWSDIDIADYKIKIKELALKLQALEVANGTITNIMTEKFNTILKNVLTLSKTEQLLLLRKIVNY